MWNNEEQGKQWLDCERSLFENGGITPKGSPEEELVVGGEKIPEIQSRINWILDWKSRPGV